MAPAHNESEENGLTPAEWKVMKVVWRHRYRGCAARDVYTETAKTEGWAPTTTKSILRRLVEKGHLNARPVGNSHLYEPAGSALKSLLAAADNLLANMLEGTMGLVITHMVEKSRLSDDELARLRQLIDDRTSKTNINDKNRP
ncbi:MAG: BlaI/MecI/CopY family transcriptional regulator [bacterium]